MYVVKLVAAFKGDQQLYVASKFYHVCVHWMTIYCLISKIRI